MIASRTALDKISESEVVCRDDFLCNVAKNNEKNVTKSAKESGIEVEKEEVA
jgi:hypothetical protein